MGNAPGHGRRAGSQQRPALVLVDIAMAYHDKGCPRFTGGRAAPALASALHLAQGLGHP